MIFLGLLEIPRPRSILAVPAGAPHLSQARLMMPSLAWGYHARPADWFAQLDAFEANGVRMVNPPSVLRWNTTKTYLVELAAKGAPVPVSRSSVSYPRPRATAIR